MNFRPYSSTSTCLDVFYASTTLVSFTRSLFCAPACGLQAPSTPGRGSSDRSGSRQSSSDAVSFRHHVQLEAVLCHSLLTCSITTKHRRLYSPRFSSATVSFILYILHVAHFQPRAVVLCAGSTHSVWTEETVFCVGLRLCVVPCIHSS